MSNENGQGPNNTEINISEEKSSIDMDLIKSLDKKLELLNELYKQLSELDKLDINKHEPKKFFYTQATGVFLDILKFTLAGICILVILSTEKGQQLTSKALPVLGFGNAAQTNLGLHMLVNQLKTEDFEDVLHEVQKKIDFEIAVLFSPETLNGPRKRLELLRQIKGYNFVSLGSDLFYETDKKLKTRMNSLEKTAGESLNYALTVARAQGNAERENFLEKIKKLYKDRKYVELLKISLPQWNSGSEIVNCSLVALITLDTEAPAFLDQVVNHPSNL